MTDTLAALGVPCRDLGAHDDRSVDYPDYAAEVASAVSEGRASRGVLLCGTGIGMSIAANKFAGVRAALLYDDFAALHARLHNDANVAVFGARTMRDEEAEGRLKIFLGAAFEEGRHAARLDKIARFEKRPGRVSG